MSDSSVLLILLVLFLGGVAGLMWELEKHFGRGRK
jgi:hypothetical protein